MSIRTKSIAMAPGMRAIKAGLLKASLLAGIGAAIATPTYSQTLWAFANAKINNTANGSVSSVFSSCNVIGILPGVTAASLIFEPGGANPIRDLAFNSPIAHDAGAATELPFPIPGKCRHFYNVQYLSGGPGLKYLALQEWDYTNPAGSGITAVGQPIILKQGASVHVVGPLRADGSRYLYAQYNQKPGGTGSELYLVRWQIFPDGSVGPMTYAGDLKTLSAESLENRAPMEMSADGQYMFYCYYPVTGVATLVIARMHLASGVTSKIATLNANVVTGLEWVPGNAFGANAAPRLYISWRHISTNNIGGISYYDLGTVPANGYTGTGTNPLPANVTDQHRFGFSDIERSRDNTLYFAENPNPVVVPSPAPASPGKLWRFNAATGTLTALALSGTPVQVCRIRDSWGYIIQNQIDGEDYSKYGYTIATPTFSVNGQQQAGGTVPTVLSCNNSVPVVVYNPAFFYTAQIEKGTLSGTTFTPAPGQPVYSKTFYTPSFVLSTEFPALEDYNGAVRIKMTSAAGCGGPYSVVQLFNLASTTALINYYMISPTDASNGPSTPVNIIDPSNASLNGLQPRFNPIDALHPVMEPSLFPAVAQPINTYTPPNVTGWAGARSTGFDQATTTLSPPVTISQYTVVVEEFDQSNTSRGIVVNKTINSSTLTVPFVFGNESSPLNYFQNSYTSIKNKYYYKLTVTGTTNQTLCPTVSRIAYFKILDGGPTGPPNSPELWRGQASLPNIKTQNIHVFPNPASDQFTVAWNCEHKMPGAAVLRLIDATGRIVLEKSLRQYTGSNEEKVGTRGLPAGIYYYVLKTADEEYKGPLSLR